MSLALRPKGDAGIMYDLIVVGGGAAGIFAALSAKDANPSLSIIVLEKSAVLLSKVRVSGGGRCNVTHACFEPEVLVQHYPRGAKELRGLFHRFQPRDTIAWFESRGVVLKTEADGRVFPTTDQSETIIACLLREAHRLGIEIRLKQRIMVSAKAGEGYIIRMREGEELRCRKLLLATGSSREGHHLAEALGHAIEKPVPSLFTFNVPTSSLKELSGVTVEEVVLSIRGSPFRQRGALLLTHFGFSGPAALKLSAWGARYLHEKDYHIELIVNWLPHIGEEDLFRELSHLKCRSPQKYLSSENAYGLPKSLWRALVEAGGAAYQKRLHDLSIATLRDIAHKLIADSYLVEGKTTHKEEFVTCGGISRKEVNFKKMESAICQGLYFAGEILDIDGITGGFNFQNAWTTAFVAGRAAAL